MALKDLTLANAKLKEAQIEELIRPYVRYDPDSGTLHFLPGAAGLTISQRALAYLIALQGWPFVGSEKQHPTTATPAQISEALNVGGGTLRPLLKRLRSARLVRAVGRAYSVANAMFEDLKRELHQRTVEKARPAPAKAPRSKKPVAKEAAEGKARGAARPRKGKRRGGEGGIFLRWIQDGFFDKPRTFREVLEHFHSQGRIIKQTSLPGYLLEATRSEILKRNKKDVDGRKVYVYTAGKSAKAG